VIDESPDIILLKDWDGRFLLGNTALARLYGTTPEQLVGKDDGAFNPNREQVDFYLENVRAVMRGGRTQIVEERSTNAETGEVRHFHSIKKPLHGPAGEPRILVIAHDITDLRRAYRVIEERERSYAYAMEAAGEGIWDWDIDAGTVTHNRRWCELLGYASDTLVHPIDAFADRLHPDDRDEVMGLLDQALAGVGSYEHEHRMRHPDGSVLWVLDRGRVVERAPDGRPLRMAGTVTDISSRKHNEFVLALATDALAHANAELERKVAERTADLARANEALARLARRDALTGLPNRLAVDERLHEEARRQPGERGTGCAVLMIDIDFFKPINDTHGHATGDEVLALVAGVLCRHGARGGLRVALRRRGVPRAAARHRPRRRAHGRREAAHRRRRHGASGGRQDHRLDRPGDGRAVHRRAGGRGGAGRRRALRGQAQRPQPAGDRAVAEHPLSRAPPRGGKKMAASRAAESAVRTEAVTSSEVRSRRTAPGGPPIHSVKGSGCMPKPSSRFLIWRSSFSSSLCRLARPSSSIRRKASGSTPRAGEGARASSASPSSVRWRRTTRWSALVRSLRISPEVSSRSTMFEVVDW
jgi:PAS domain S-box-containing protein